MKLLLNSTSTALWHQIIHEAEASCAITLKEDLESYLVFLMMRYTTKPEIANQIFATDFLQSIDKSSLQRDALLQEVGDKCLIYSGLFPRRTQKKLVKISYFVKLGQSSYAIVSKTDNDLYSSLAREFVPLMDVLQSVVSVNHLDLLPLEAYEMWNETGSQRALAILKKYSKGSPVNF